MRNLITSEILKGAILNLQGKESQEKISEAKDGYDRFKDIINEKINVKDDKSLNIQDSSINLVENNGDENISNMLSKLLLPTNGLQIENNNCTDNQKFHMLLSAIVEKLQSIMANETSSEIYGQHFNNSELSNKLFTKDDKSNITEFLDFKLTEDKRDEINKMKIILNKLDSALSGEIKEKCLKENPQVFMELFNIKKEVQNLETKQLNKISLEDLKSLNEITKGKLDKVKSEPDNILSVLSAIVEKLQSIVLNKTSDKSYGEDFKSNDFLSKLLAKEKELNSKDIQFLNRLALIKDEPNSNITANPELKLASSKKKELMELGEILSNLVSELNVGKIEESLKEIPQLVSAISNITESLEELGTKQLEQIPLENLSSLKQITASTLDELKKEPDNILVVLSPMVEKLQGILVNKTSNEGYDEDSKNGELLSKLFTKENKLDSKDIQLINRVVSTNNEANFNITENLNLKLVSSKKKELKELGEVLTKLVEELNGGKFEESLKEISQIVNVISNTGKELEKILPEQLEEISLEDLSSLKKMVSSASDKVKSEPNSIFSVLLPIVEKLQNIVVNKPSDESYGENSKSDQLLSKLFTKENDLNSKDKQFLDRLLPINNEPNSNADENLDLKLASSKKKELKELEDVLTKLVVGLNDVKLEEGLKQSPQVIREISNITKDLAKLEHKQLEQISSEDLSALKEMVKSALSMTKGSQSKKPLKGNLVSTNNDINVEYGDSTKAKDYFKEDLSINRLGFKLAKNHGNSKIGSVKDENILNNSKEDSLLKKIISGSEKNNQHTLMFTQRFNEMKNIDQVKNDLVINKNTMVNDVVKIIKYMAENHERTLTVKMNPKDLGEITIKIVAQGESMKATITAASRDTAILLNANEMEMKKMLDAQGIKISEVNISLYNDDTTFFREQAGFGRQNESHRQNQNQNTTVSNKELDDEKLNEALDNTNNINMFA